jgi:hypothetical protein
MFWEHHDLLLSCDRESLLATIEQITKNGASSQDIATSCPTPIAATQNAVALGRLADQVPKGCIRIHIRSYEENNQCDISSDHERALELWIKHDKQWEREFVQEILPAVDAFCAKEFAMQQSKPQLAVLHSSSTVDAAIGVTVMVLARYFGVEGDLLYDSGTIGKLSTTISRPSVLMGEQRSQKS